MTCTSEVVVFSILGGVLLLVVLTGAFIFCSSLSDYREFKKEIENE